MNLKFSPKLFLPFLNGINETKLLCRKNILKILTFNPLNPGNPCKPGDPGGP